MLALQEEVGVVSKGLNEDKLKELKKLSYLADRQLVASNTKYKIYIYDKLHDLPQLNSSKREGTKTPLMSSRIP